MTVPTASDLITEKFLRPPTSARGVYLDRRPGHKDVHMRFIWAAPNKWMWMHATEPAAGAITDGTTNVIVEDGVAVLVTDQGEVSISHRLRNLLQPSGYDYDGWELGSVSAGTAIGRRAWITSANPDPGVPGKAAHELVFDAESGVILFMRTGDVYLGFEELALNEDIEDEAFRWNGRIEPREIGNAFVARDRQGGYTVSWQVAVRGRPMFHQEGPDRVTRDEAVAWGEARALSTQIRDE